MKKVLILGCGPASINVAKSIKEIGDDILIYATDIDRYNLHFMKPYCEKVFYIQKDKLQDRIDEYKQIIQKNNIDYIHPQPDQEVLLLAKSIKEGSELNRYTFLPDLDIVEKCQDKLYTANKWSKIWSDSKAIPINTNTNIKTLKSEFGDSFWVRSSHGAGGKGSILIKDRDNHKLDHWLRFWLKHDKKVKFIAQKYLRGRNLAWISIWKQGTLLASQGRERLQYLYPNLAISGITGTPTIARTTNDDVLNQRGFLAVKSIDPKPEGIYCVDFKCNEYDEPIPTEINVGRYFTTSYFYTKAGFNFVDLELELFFNNRVKNLKKYDLCKPNQYWIRHIDSEARLLTEKEFNW